MVRKGCEQLADRWTEPERVSVMRCWILSGLLTSGLPAVPCLSSCPLSSSLSTQQIFLGAFKSLMQIKWLRY